jgi:hypothetical protein
VEDVLLGWALGIALAVVALRRADALARWWNALAHARQVALVAAASAALWLFTRALGGASEAPQPSAFVSYAGFLTGIVIAHRLELRTVDFDPRSASWASKLVRYALSVALVAGTLFVLDAAFAALAADATPLGDLLRYLRYAAAGVVGIWLGPLLFLRLGLASASCRPALPA